MLPLLCVAAKHLLDDLLDLHRQGSMGSPTNHIHTFTSYMHTNGGVQSISERGREREREREMISDNRELGQTKYTSVPSKVLLIVAHASLALGFIPVRAAYN